MRESQTDYETFEFDNALRLTKLVDWYDGNTNGLQYAYDAANRLTSLTDYDGSTLDYAYDDANRITSQNDYHNNVTTYTYTARDQLSTITAPGSRVWDFDYNALGQPTGYTHPNGLATAYAYDTRNRLTKIEHKDGTTPLDSFTYALDTGGLITRVTQVDGSYWDYTYDNRYRLTGATRNNAGATLTASYAYTYDLGDNLLTKVEPFREDFNDGSTTGWTASSGTWSATGYYAANSNGSDAILSRANTDGSNELWLRYYRQSGSTSAEGVVYPRYTDADNWVRVVLSPSGMALEQKDGGTLTALDTDSATADDTWYNLHVVADGANVNVYRRSGTGLESLVLSTTAATETGTASLVLGVTGTGTFRYDDLQCLSADLSNTTTFGVNNANELTSMTDPNGTTSFGFDAWGRMTSKSLGSVSATYAYRYGQMLTSVSTTFPDEGNVTYDYGGNNQRRERTVGSTTTHYNWDADFELISEEDGSGTLTRSYTGRLADIAGTNPATGSTRYYHGDHLGSTRLLTDGSKDALATSEFTPYGTPFSQSGNGGTWSFAMLADDDPSGLLYAPFRFYSPSTGRWSTPDPLAMVGKSNVYAYVSDSPTRFTDSSGLVLDTVLDVTAVGVDVFCGHYGTALIDSLLSFVPFVPAIGSARLAARIGGKLPWQDVTKANKVVAKLHMDKNGNIYPTAAYYDARGYQRLRSDWEPGHWGAGKGANPHSHWYGPMGGGWKGAPQSTMAGDLRKVIC